MRKIQLISHNVNQKLFPNITVSSLESPKSLDEFDLNIIDLSAGDIWHHMDSDKLAVDSQNDFRSIQTMVSSKKRSKVLYLFPQNELFSYYYYCARYNNTIRLKDMLQELTVSILHGILPLGHSTVSLVFENTRTTVGSTEYEADFFFASQEPLTKSNMSEKCTTIALNDRETYATTLKISKSQSDMLNYVNIVLPEMPLDDVPEWVKRFVFGNDEEQQALIETSKKIISEENEKIEQAEKTLEHNLHYKSILYTNGNQLVEVVFEILEKLLNYDLSDFVDMRKEDFLIKKEECTFIGEIKGVTSNVKNEHISQVDVHYQGYIDQLEADGIKENIRQLLIMNPFRTKEISARDPVFESQIKLAVRNGCLIITTEVLLKTYEMYCNGRISSADCIRVFSENTGLLTIDRFSEESFDQSPYMV